MIARNVVYQGHVLDILKDWPSNIINCVVTSPPYWVMRLYKGLTPQVWGGKKTCKHEWTPHIIKKQRGSLGVSGWDRPSRKVHAGNKESPSLFCSKCGAWKGDLGNEPLIDLYVEHLADIMDEVKRVVRKDGTLWLNLGDTYYGSGFGSTGKQTYLLENGSFKAIKPTGELPRKCMADIPHRVIIELVRRGWIHRSTVIWHKPAALPESCKDRPTIDYEYLFMLTKHPTYYYEQQFEPVQDSTLKKKTLPIVGGNKYVNLPAPYSQKYSGKPVEAKPYRNLRSVWRISTARSPPEAHFATFPTKLIQTPIMASCPTQVCTECGEPVRTVYRTKGFPRDRSNQRDEVGSSSGINTMSGSKLAKWREMNPVKKATKRCSCCAGYKRGLVLDPFMGSGTTALVARALGRDWVGIELSDEYVEMTYKRLLQ